MSRTIIQNQDQHFEGKIMTRQEKEFWEKLKNWHLDDIDICLANKANYAGTRTMLSFIDILGGFYGGLILKEVNDIYECKKCGGKKLIKKNKYLVRAGGERKNNKVYKIDGVEYKESGSKKEFLNFVESYMKEFYQSKIEYQGRQKRAADILYDHFRCGLVHEGHPKLGTSIFRENSKVILRLNYESIPIALNILALRDLARRAVFHFEKHLHDPEQKERIMRWRDRYKFIATEFRF